MYYLIVKDGVIVNIIVCDSNAIAEQFGAVQYYEGAAIGEVYNPPKPDPEPSIYIPTPEASVVVMMRAAFAQQVKDMEDDMILQCSGLADPWAPGDHKSGEIYNVGDQTWECFADYNNGTYPDVKPSNPSWFTFNRPLHGKSLETARPFVPVQGAHDMYRAGEYAVWTDGKTYRCKNDTNFSPEEYSEAWEVAA